MTKDGLLFRQDIYKKLLRVSVLVHSAGREVLINVLLSKKNLVSVLIQRSQYHCILQVCYCVPD